MRLLIITHTHTVARLCIQRLKQTSHKGLLSSGAGEKEKSVCLSAVGAAAYSQLLICSSFFSSRSSCCFIIRRTYSTISTKSQYRTKCLSSINTYSGSRVSLVWFVSHQVTATSAPSAAISTLQESAPLELLKLIAKCLPTIVEVLNITSSLPFSVLLVHRAT
jgi:hypothetical protein